MKKTKEGQKTFSADQEQLSGGNVKKDIVGKLRYQIEAEDMDAQNVQRNVEYLSRKRQFCIMSGKFSKM